MNRRVLFATAVVAGAVSAQPAYADWQKIGKGPTLDYARAYCENAAMGAPQPGYFVMGSPLQVGMGSFGYGLGMAIRRAKYQRNCMIMLGWKEIKPAKSARDKKPSR